MKIDYLINRLREFKDRGFEDVLTSCDPEGNDFYTTDVVEPIWEDEWLEQGYDEEDIPRDELLKSLVIWPGHRVQR